MELTPPPRQKSSKHYLVYRIYAVAVILAWNTIGIWELLRAARISQPPVALWFLTPFLIPAIFMLFNLAVFKFDYSMFGTLERTVFSNDPIVEELEYTRGQIAWFSATGPFLTWRVHQNGLSFRALGVGSGYVPYSQCTDIKSDSSGCRISHSSYEVRSPLIISDKKICALLSEQLTAKPGDQRKNGPTVRS